MPKHHLFVIAHHAERVALTKPRNAGLGVWPIADDVAGAHEFRAGFDAVDVAQDGVQGFEIAVNIGDERYFHGV